MGYYWVRWKRSLGKVVADGKRGVKLARAAQNGCLVALSAVGGAIGVTILLALGMIPKRYVIGLNVEGVCGSEIQVSHGSTRLPVSDGCHEQRYVLWSAGTNPIDVQVRSDGVSHTWSCGYESTIGVFWSKEFQLAIRDSGGNVSVDSEVERRREPCVPHRNAP